MDTSLLLTIIGLAATFIFGFLSIDLFKRKRYPGKVTFVKQYYISLFDNIVKNFNEISILFENIPIKENLIYVKGCFINDGDIDIEGGKIEKPISVTLPKDFKWVSCKITNSSKDLTCNYSIRDNQNLEFDFGLFRRNEFYQIEALIEATHGKAEQASIFDDLVFSHRISQTQKISTTNLLTESQMKKKKGNMKRTVLSTALQMFLPFIVLLVVFVYFKSSELNYKSKLNGKIVRYEAAPKSDGFVELTNISTSEEIRIPISEFQSKSKYIPYIPVKTIWQRILDTWYVFVMWVTLILVFVGIDYWELRKSNKIYNILKDNR